MKSRLYEPINLSTVTSEDIHHLLNEAKGMVMVQETQYMESIAQSIGVPYEMKNKYKLSLLPEDKSVARSPDDPTGWCPSGEELVALDRFLFVQEESGCCVRLFLTFCGMSNLRPLKLHFRVINDEVFLAQRPFKCGGGCCCPLTMNLYSGDENNSKLIGRVREDFDNYMGKCFSLCCTCTSFHSIEKSTSELLVNPSNFEKLYTLRANLACCGRVNNCCGATCLKNDMVFDILDRNGMVVAHLQKTYAPDSTCCGAFCRMSYKFSNYMLEFPAGCTPEGRALLIASMFQLDYQFFEKKGGDK